MLNKTYLLIYAIILLLVFIPETNAVTYAQTYNYFSFNESSGNFGNLGTSGTSGVATSITYGQLGINNNSANFSVATSKVQLTQSAVSGMRWYNFWWQSTSNPAASCDLFSDGDGSTWGKWGALNASGYFIGNFFSGASYFCNSAFNIPNVNNGQINMITMGYDGVNCYLYLNKNIIQNQSAGGFTTTRTGSTFAYLGDANIGADGACLGKMDEYSEYLSYNLTQSDINLLYNQYFASNTTMQDAYCTSCSPVQNNASTPWITDDTTPTINATLSVAGTCAIGTNQSISGIESMNYTTLKANGGIDCSTTNSTNQVCTFSTTQSVSNNNKICMACKNYGTPTIENPVFCHNLGIYTFTPSVSTPLSLLLGNSCSYSVIGNSAYII